MSPPKPWEKSAPTPQQNPQGILGDGGIRWNNNNSFAGAGDFNGLSNIGGSSSSAQLPPPPLPPRPVTTATNLGTNYGGGMYDYGSSGAYGSSVTNPYYYGGGGGGIAPYSSIYGGGYGVGGYNRYSNYYGANNNSNNNGDFVRLAEEQSRTAFQSVESIVQAFSSVSMMMESTLNAIHSSFRAVLGVADQFSRLKLQLSQILYGLAAVRFLRYLWRRFLIFLRFRPATGNSDELWRQIMTAGASGPTAAQILAAHGAAGKPTSSWPTLVFFCFVLGGPFLIWKLVSKLVASVEEQKRWATGEKSHFVAVAMYDFDAGSNGELTVRAGQRLRLAPKEMQPTVRGWILGSTDGQHVGLVPANYIKIIGKQNVDDTSSTNSSDEQPSTSGMQPSMPAIKSKSSGDFTTTNADLEKLFEEAG